MPVRAKSSCGTERKRLVFIAGLAMPVIILLVIAVLYFFNSPFPMSDH